MIREAVVETFPEVVAAVNRGADRIELCANMNVGGTTPSYGMVKCAVDYCHHMNVEVAVMIRPRGTFTYDVFEQEVMRQDIIEYTKLGADYFVCGALTADSSLDVLTLQKLMSVTHIPFVMHMAYDHIPKHQQLKAMDQLIELGVIRLLTHGSADAATSILDNISQLARLLVYSKGRLEIMPGGSLTKDNVEQLISQIPFQEVHGTKIV
ncbi:copper homeostasis protein CutC [Macrococcus equipercicus]|uniref:PF03932 family protein CutC n=1 Tax=Macrococcus equipercicus TaxID=69967 RepID=A0A9Q9BUA8_9STAP|nr:copper homeostasis protein CutC [Macrococcus equipercicus]KAA1039892.1 copper homeostasis protein CutC [Macrococcus equipercicus]UTH13157.1 copper homeostasis protein CutC [Macrococcus equipercicus]